MKKYIALDTETYRGKAFLLSHAEGVYEILSFDDFLKACAALGNRFVFFNLDYDVSALVKHLPETIVKRLYLDKVVKYRGLKLRYLAGKYLKVCSPLGNFHFYDVYPFYQTSLENAAKKYLNVRKMGISKALLSNLSPRRYRQNKEKVDRYAIRDALVTQQLTDLITAALEECGLEVEHLYSPGYIAKRWLKKQGVKIRGVPQRFNEFVRACYFGARIEVTQRGKIASANIYDLKSAYPSALAELPNFSKAHYKLSKKIESKFYFVKARVWMEEAESYLLPYREKSAFSGEVIIFPRYQGQTAFMSSVEYEYLLNNKLARIEIEEVLNLVITEEKPFAELINDLFERRKESQGKSILFKLILNSLYGIFAENVREYKQASCIRGYYQALRGYESTLKQGFIHLMSERCPHCAKYWQKKCACVHCKFLRRSFRFRRFKDKPLFTYQKTWYYRQVRNGRFNNLALASFITAKTRVKIFDLQRKCGDKFVACFTDSIIVESPIVLQTGKGIGALELKSANTSLLVIGSGVYETEEETKMRGYEWHGKLSKLMRKYPNKRIYRIPQKLRISSGIFVRRPMTTFDDFNELQVDAKRLDLNFDRKRVWERKFKNGKDALRNCIKSCAKSLTM